MANRIRRLSIGKEVKQSFHYTVGLSIDVFIDNEEVTKKLSEIIETESSYKLYLSSSDEIQLWKVIPKNDSTTTEYFID